jgi:Spy/CpxP family protein refolding chaperone
MISLNLRHRVATAVCVVVSFVALPSFAADDAPAPAPAPKRDAQTVLNEMRMKSLVKELELTDEQKPKVQKLLDEEYVVVTKIREDQSLSLVERADKIKAAQNDTYGKLKPILTEKQAEKLDSLRAKTGRKKKPAA